MDIGQPEVTSLVAVGEPAMVDPVGDRHDLVLRYIQFPVAVCEGLGHGYEVAVLPNRTGYPRPGGLREPDPVADAAVDLDVIPIRPQDRRGSAVQSGSQKTGWIGIYNLPHVVLV